MIFMLVMILVNVFDSFNFFMGVMVCINKVLRNEFINNSLVLFMMLGLVDYVFILV